MMQLDKERVRVVIVGGGLGGIATAIALKRQLGFDNFLIYEKATDVGGTWQANVYPGCASDVAGHWYSLSTDPNPYWANYYATQPELKAYWKGLVNKYALHKHLVLGTRVVGAAWNEQTQAYTVTLRDEQSQHEWNEIAEFVVEASGGLSTPAYPNDVDRTGPFSGVQFHSAQWKTDVDLKGKRVGVVGNGCSAAQIMPQISKDRSIDIVNFCRTPSWFVKRRNFAYPKWVQWTFANVPFAGRLYRNFVYVMYEVAILIFIPYIPFLQRQSAEALKTRMIKKAPKKYLENLMPKYPAGCKRLIIDPGYIDCMHYPNVTLRWDIIDAVIPEGLRMKSGEIVPLDVIVWATGFNVLDVGVDAKGRGGMSISEFYESKGGSEAYLGTSIPNFPNYFLLMGPNTATGHASIVFSEEVQINYFLQLMKPVIERKAKSFEVRAAVNQTYNDEIQRRVKRTVWTQCASWYQSNGKNVAIFPGPLFLFWWWARKPKWENYIATGAERWEAERRRRQWFGAALLVGVISLCVGMTQPSFRETAEVFCSMAVAKLQSFL